MKFQQPFFHITHIHRGFLGFSQKISMEYNPYNKVMWSEMECLRRKFLKSGSLRKFLASNC
jgi:hypothetical protein